MKGIRRFIGDRAFYRMVLAIMLPIMLQNGITNFVGLLDNIMIGRVGTDQMSGVSIANQLLLIFNLASIGGASAAGLFGAQFYGKGDHRGVRDVLRIKLWFSVIISVLGALVFTVFGRQILSLFLHEGGSTGNAEATLEYGMTYLMLARFLLFPFSVVQAYSSTLRETAKTVPPMRAGLIAVFVNLFFNWVLIFGKLGAPAMGVSGAILATIISRVVEAVLVISWTHRNSAINAFTEGLYESLRVPWDLVRSVIVKGWPLLLNEVVWSAGMATLSQCYSTRGLAVVAGYSIASTVNQLFNIIFISFGIAIGIIVGNLLGADKLEEARDTDYKLIAFSVTTSCLTGLILFLIGPYYPLLYNTTDEVRHLATVFIRINAMLMPCYAFVGASYFTLRSGGKTLITFLFDGVFMWVVNVPVAMILAHLTNLSAIMIYLFSSLLVLIKTVYGAVLVRKGVWINNMVKDGY
ncbi:MAG: MATE family efflux transporter [Clostridia bacterium]|nr:MATE family efflux transporter [Clostridia bacterium]